MQPPRHCPGDRERAPGVRDYCGIRWQCARYYSPQGPEIAARFEGLICRDFVPLQPRGRDR